MVFSYSKLVVNQVNGLMLTRDSRMIVYKSLVFEMAKRFKSIQFINVLREKNSKTN